LSVSSDASVCTVATRSSSSGSWTITQSKPYCRSCVDLRLALLRHRLDQLVDVVERAAELARRLRLERHRGDAGRLQVELGVERDRRRREREQPVGFWFGELLLAEEDVPQPH
jgi:hypothetical protein